MGSLAAANIKQADLRDLTEKKYDIFFCMAINTRLHKVSFLE